MKDSYQTVTKGLKPLASQGSSRGSGIVNPVRPRLFTLKDAAVYLNRSVYSLREMVWKGKIPYIQEGANGKLWIDAGDLDKWIESNKKRTVF